LKRSANLCAPHRCSYDLGIVGSSAQDDAMKASVGYLVIDAVDPERLAGFWCGLLEVAVAEMIGEGQFVVLSATSDGLTVGFQRVPEAKAGKNRLHLDLVVEDLDTATTEIEALGGHWLEPGSTRELEGFRWRVMADPEGNEFDIDVLPAS
jgi:predicted enzyme related to lactoylglutathione lyase